MAAAEVRTVWHRIVNQPFVQEDAKRAPKFACRQSSYATSKLDDLGLATAIGEPVHNAAAMMKKTCMEGKLEAHSKNSDACLETVPNHETITEIDSVGCLVSKEINDFSLDSDYSWIQDHNSQPWWKNTDRDELASMVSQKSLNYVKNCDLPPPRKTYLGDQPCANSSVFSNFKVHAKESLDSRLMYRKIEHPSEIEHLYFSSDKTSSYKQDFEGDQSKAQLMEALCHSQTRAREAEELAKQAYNEKERVIALFFIQASQLFAYKQWFRLLHFETLNAQITNKDEHVSTPFQEDLPWMCFEGKKPLKRNRKQRFVNDNKEKFGEKKSDISTTYSVAFALGLSLVGAGLLLGWTAGWMLPSS